MEITLRLFHESDTEVLSQIMKRAFNEDAMMNRGFETGPEGYDDGSFIRKYTVYPGTVSYTIYENDKPIGLTILWIDSLTNENTLGCLFTDPERHSVGVGTIVWKKIEEMYPKTHIWRTETPLCSVRNLNFYINKCGFMAYRIDEPKNREEALVQFIKYME